MWNVSVRETARFAAGVRKDSIFKSGILRAGRAGIFHAGRPAGILSARGCLVFFVELAQSELI